MLIGKRMDFSPIHRAVPAGLALSKVKIRLASPQDRPLWDTLMDTRHYLGFQRLAGRSLRYIVSYENFWLGLAAWQNGAFKCAPRDRSMALT